MFWFCLLHKFAPLHTQTDPCRLKCSSGVEGKVHHLLKLFPLLHHLPKKANCKKCNTIDGNAIDQVPENFVKTNQILY